VSKHQIASCAPRIADAKERDRFIRMLTRADELAAQSTALRLAAWQRYRELTGYEKGAKAGKYA
jgi:hypothetical protein